MGDRHRNGLDMLCMIIIPVPLRTQQHYGTHAITRGATLVLTQHRDRVDQYRHSKQTGQLVETRGWRAVQITSFVENRVENRSVVN